MKTLVLAEKPSVGKDIARVLGCRGGNNGYIEGPKHIVTWALGHLVTLADPEEYDKKYKTWDINDLPIMPKELRLTVIPQTSKQYKTVKDLLLRKDVSDIVIATDAGREGELVARWIIEKAKCHKPIKRLWISSVTDKAIREGFQNLKDGRQYVSLADSAKARAEADWLVGINATRCLTTKFNSQLSCGRVQTPTLAIIVKREEEIRSFVPKPYYGLVAHTGNVRLTWQDRANNSSRCFDKGKIDGLLAQLKTVREGTVTEVDKTIKKKYAPQLYDLTELQRDANKRFGYSPKDTLSIMQRLYEEHKVLTYPRTDSRYLSSDIVPTLPERLKACQVPPYAKMCTHILRTSTRLGSNYVNDAKVSDHHAIIPTEHPVNLSSLNEKERKIYDLVVTRFLSVFYPPYEYENATIKVKINNEIFTAKGKVVISQGYKAVYMGDDEDDDGDDQALPNLKRFQTIPINGMKLTEGKTSPPSPFNEATLLSAMESPAKYMDTKDRALAETLEQTGGLGTVATRADIIEKLYDNFLIEKRGNDVLSTSKGRQLLTLVPKDLKSPELTGNWEQILQGISKGQARKDKFLLDIRKYTSELIMEIKNSTQTFRHDNLSSTRCPVCGMFMLQVAGKKGEMLVCQDRECNERINVSLSIRSQCPKCRKFLKIVGEGEGRKVVCICGHREKYESFEKRKAEEKNAMSKRDIQAFMDNMNKKDKKEEKNNAFAALKGLKF
ncbi:MAG: DNA topoisomerase III [Firmicutes bacterium]|nr:DNA topoisomerase III [Bacillota bacterium]